MKPAIQVQQPLAFDLVGSTVLVAGLGTGFEATISARVRDGNGTELASTAIMVGGGLGEIGQFHAAIPLPVAPPTPNGFVEVWEDNAGFPKEGPYGGTVAELNKAIVPVVFGTNLIADYIGYVHYVVRAGDTLSGIAASEYGSGTQWPRIFEANRDQIGDPNKIFTGQQLRIPRGGAMLPMDVSVWFVDTDRYQSPGYDYMVAVSRTVSAVDPVQGALAALFAGPTASEQTQNLALTLSQATGFTDVTVNAGVARVRLLGGCNSGGSTLSIADHISPTLKQFPHVQYVKILDPAGTTGDPIGPSDSIPTCLEP